MRKSVYRFLALFLCFVLFFSLAACGKEKPAPTDAAGTVKAENLYTPEWESSFQPLQSDRLWSLRPVFYTDSGFYATATVSLGQANAGEEERYGTVICFVDQSGKVEVLPNYSPDLPAANNGMKDFYSTCTPGRPVMTADGKLALLEIRETGWYAGPDAVYGNTAYYQPDYLYREQSIEYLTLDTDGNVLSRVPVNLDPGDAFLNISDVAAGPDGSILAGLDKELLCIGREGSVLWKAQAADYITGLLTLADGTVAITTSEGGKPVLCTLDPAAHSLSAGREIPETVWSPIPGNGEYDLFFSGGLALFGLKIGEEPVPILNWLDCDINGQTLDAGALSVGEDGTVRGLVSDYEDGREVTQLFTLKKADGTAKSKSVLSLAQLQFYPDYTLINRILRFNRSHEDVRIVLRDYSLYDMGEDTSAAAERLMADIAAGNAPDLLPLEELPYRQLAARGLLQDLNPWLDKDKELQREDFVPNVLSALECGGGLYQVVPGFTVETLLGSADLVGTEPGWTYEDFFSAYAQMPAGADILNPNSLRDDVLSMLLRVNYDRFVDWQNGEADFESDEFKQLLQFAALFPADEGQTGDDALALSAAERILSRQQMLDWLNFYAPETLLWNKLDFGDAPVTCVGWPSESGNGNVLRMDPGYAMSSSCRDPETAWEFLRSFLTEDGQREVSSLPTNRKVLDRRLEDLMTVETLTDSNGNQLLDEAGQPVRRSLITWYDEAGTEHRIESLSRTQADEFLALIEGCGKMSGYDNAVFSLVAELAEPYFLGTQSVDDTARLIQSKVSVYMDEMLHRAEP